MPEDFKSNSSTPTKTENHERSRSRSQRSRSKSRSRRRKLTGAFIYSGLALFTLLAIGMVGGFMKRRHIKREIASINSHEPAAIDVIDRLKRELGKDKFGVLTTAILEGQMAPASGIGLLGKSICAKKTNCPVSLSSLYSTGFSRLDAASDAHAMQALQIHLLQSDLTKQEKQLLILESVLKSKMYIKSQPSVMVGKNQVKFSDAAFYYNYSADQLAKLGMPRQSLAHAIQVVTARDKVAHDLILSSIGQ